MSSKLCRYVYNIIDIRDSVCNILDILEKITIKIPFLRDWVLGVHERALYKLLELDLYEPPIRFIVVGGGIFPRTAIILRKLFPDAQIIIQDMNHKSLRCAENYMRNINITDDIIYLNSIYNGTYIDLTLENLNSTVVILPLAFRGKIGIAKPITYKTLKHCWIWDTDPYEKQSLVSYFLLKKIKVLV